MKISDIKWPEKLAPFKGVILFAVIMMLSNVFWKYNLVGDEAKDTDSTVMLWGMNISTPFVFMAHHVAHFSKAILNFLDFSVILRPNNVLGYENGSCVQIIWGCTGLKQAYICFCILAFSIGPWRKKLWFVPLGLFVVYAFNIFRISFIVASVENHPDWFHFLHLYAFKYGFYLIIFLLWVLWEERISGNVKPKLQASE
jgi:exosortase/archaeosortase family protein